MDSVINAIAQSLYSALLRDLPEVPATVWKPGTERERAIPARRPREDECEIYSWPETWGSTALGYGGIGGSMVTTAQTVLVTYGYHSYACVYWGSGGRLGFFTDDKDVVREMISCQSTHKFSRVR